MNADGQRMSLGEMPQELYHQIAPVWGNLQSRKVAVVTFFFMKD
jgi:hypothetical protein